MEDFQYDEKAIYLMNPKTGEIVGLHAIGQKDAEWVQVELDGTRTQKKGFFADDKWGNPYDKFLNFTGNSFRVHTDIEVCAMEFINDGWVDLDETKVSKFMALTDDLLMHKFFYYEKNAPIISDYQYDLKEKDWQRLGTEIGLVMEEYPFWVDFDRRHPRAYYAIKLAENRLTKKLEDDKV